MSSPIDFLQVLGQQISPTPGNRRILSDHVRIRVKDRNGNVVRVGEFDRFEMNQRNSVRIFKPVGNTREIGILQEGGWDLSFSGGKVDWNLARLIHNQEVIMNQHGADDLPFNPLGGIARMLTGDMQDAAKYRNINPTFDIEHTTIYYDGSYETYVFEDTIIYGYSSAIEGNLEEVKESAKGFSPKRRKSDEFILEDVFIPNAAFVVQDIVKEIQRKRDGTNWLGDLL